MHKVLKERAKSIYLSILPLILLISLFAFSGCEERGVTFVVDADVLRDYISQTEEGRDLFRVDNIFLEDPFTIDGDSAIYKIIVDSVYRSIVVDTTPVRVLKDFGGSIGMARDAEVIVDDFFHLRVLRIENGDTTFSSHKRALTRVGFFLKLGSDAQANLGWLLWGYNGGAPESPAEMVIRSNRNVEFRGDQLEYSQLRYVLYDTLSNGEVRLVPGYTDYKYIRLSMTGLINAGDLLYITSSKLKPTSYYQLISAESDSGFVLYDMNRLDATHWVDTVATRHNSPHIWDLLSFQEVQAIPIVGSNPPDTTFVWNGWTVPFRFEQ